LQVAENATGHRPPELDGPPCPPELVYVLTWFYELAAARGSSGFGLNPISYSEIDAWARLSGIEIDSSEVALVRLVDAAFLRSLTDGRPSRHSNNRG
jgi:hypothetical protein